MTFHFLYIRIYWFSIIFVTLQYNLYITTMQHNRMNIPANILYRSTKCFERVSYVHASSIWIIWINTNTLSNDLYVYYWGYNDADTPLIMIIESRRKVLIKTFRRLSIYALWWHPLDASFSVNSVHGKIQCIINRAVMRINEQNYEL